MSTTKMLSKTDAILKFDKLSYKLKVEILVVALDFMQQYNGRSKTTCIALAMGDYLSATIDPKTLD